MTQLANENKGQHVIFISLLSGKPFGFVLRHAIAAVAPVSAPLMRGLGGWICWMMHHLSTYHSRLNFPTPLLKLFFLQRVLHVMTQERYRCESFFPEDRPPSHTSLILCTLSHHRHTPVISLQSLFISSSGWIHAEARGSRCSESEPLRGWLSRAIWPLHLALSTSYTLQSGPDCAKIIQRETQKKIKNLAVLQITCNVRAKLCFFYLNRNTAYRLSMKTSARGNEIRSASLSVVLSCPLLSQTDTFHMWSHEKRA